MNTMSAYKPHAVQEGPRKGLKAGVWMDGTFDWHSEQDSFTNHAGEVRTLIQAFTKSQVSFVTCTIKNNGRAFKYPKFVFQYENILERQAVAFYSPPERAILHMSQGSISLLGGTLKGQGISQYCIQGKGNLYKNGCFKSLKDGILSYSPLAKGEVSSIFSLEAEIGPGECAEAMAWVIHTPTKEEAQGLNEGLLRTL
ncbi:hypothetical protein ACFVHQ_03215 [Actinomycetes bacterium NPDC127524]|uniref:hypothetical protein n=1 Tax=Bacillus sp. MUM 13 TaxID=1678001 RepID=UPI0008F5F449|nr:hypothetical protein [Bacillus sp. MUM 13]OIK12234.1 hypothetical protein BIV59_09655 [Bacillus sp. MUM 13]